MFPGVLCKRATTIQELYLTQRTPHTDHCGSRRWQGGKNRRRHKRSFTTDTEVNQMLLHSLVNEQQSKQTSETCSSFPGSPSQHPHLGLMYFSVPLSLHHASGTEVLARGLIGTCTQMRTITECHNCSPPYDKWCPHHLNSLLLGIILS